MRNALRPGYAQVMARKGVGRLSPKERSGDAACSWARTRRRSAAEVCAALDEKLWEEAVAFADVAKQRADDVSAELGRTVGFGSRPDLLYFTTRWREPDIVVETGVAFGYSSFTILSALQRNGHGRLYSSDFPFFREHEPERLVGALVPAELRDGWTLLTQGDAVNLRRILAAIGDAPIELVHYDSDKSYSGRRRALALLEPHLAPDVVLLMDDIEDNTFFRDYVVAPPGREHLVIGHSTHFVGAVGLPQPPPAQPA